MVDRGELDFPHLAPIDIERLGLLLEELCEAGQIVGKILRHGFTSYNPFDTTQTPNYVLLERELGDVLCAMDLLAGLSQISMNSIEARRAKKHESVKKWLHFTP